jgi:hypothetical protein
MRRCIASTRRPIVTKETSNRLRARWGGILHVLLPLLAGCSAASRPALAAEPAVAPSSAPAPARDASVASEPAPRKPATVTPPSPAEVTATPAAATLNAMAASATKIFIRGEQGCKEWELSGWWGETLEQLRLERVVGTHRVKGAQRRTRVTRLFDYQKGYILDANARGAYEDVWDERSQTWTIRREELSQHACFSLIKPVIEPDGSILVGAERWHPSAASCEAAANAVVLSKPDCW